MASKKSTRKDKASSASGDDTFRLLFENHPIPMWVYDLKTLAFLEVNDAAVEKYGYAHDEFLALTIKDIRPAEDTARLLIHLEEERPALQHSGEWRHRLKNGQIIDVEITSHTLKFEEHEAALVMAQDITGRKQTVNILRQSEERYRLLFDRMADGLYRSTHEGKFVDVNPAMIRMFGYASKEEMLEVDIKKDLYFAPEERGSHILDTGQEETETYRMRRKDGSEIWVEDHGLYVHDEQGNIIFHEGMLRDITERKRSRDALRDSQAQITGIFNSAMDAIITIDERQQVIIFNPAAERMFRCAASEVIDQTLDRFLPEFVRKDHREYLRTFGQSNLTKRSMETPSLILTCVRADGEAFPSEVSISQLEIGGRKLYTAIVRDITERKRAEKAVFQEKNFNQAAINSLPGLFYLFDEHGHFLRWNKNFENVSGYSAAEISRMAFLDFFKEPDKGLMAKFIQDVFSNGESSAEGNFTSKDRRQSPYFFTGKLFFLEDKPCLLGMGIDITARKQAEEAINQRMAEQSILHQASQSLLSIHLDPETIYTTLHQAVVQIMPFEVLTIVLEDENRGDYHAVYLYDAGQRYPSQRIPRGKGLSGKVIASGETLFIHDNLLSNAPLIRFGSPQPVRSILAVPLRKNNETIGMVSAQSYQPNAYNERHRVLLETLAAQITTVIENARLFEAERKQRQMSDALRDALGAGASMSVSLDFETILDRLLETLERVVPFDGASIMLVEPEKQMVSIAKVRGYKMLEKQLVDKISKFSFDIAAAENLRWILNNKQPLVISDIEQYPGWVRIPVSSFIRSWMGAPIIINDEVIALFSLDSTEPNFFTNEHVELLRAFTGQASLALQNARLFDETAHRAQEFASLYETSGALSAENELNSLLQVIVEHAKKLLGSASGGMYLYLSETNELELTVTTMSYIPLGTRLRLGEGMAGHVAQTHQPLRKDDYSIWEGRSPVYDGIPIRAVLEVPMLYGGELIGVLTANEAGDSERKFTEADERLLTLFASQAAGAIHSARLREQTARRLDQLQALHLIDRAISSSFDLRPILNTVISQTIAQLGVDAADVLLFHPHLQTLEYVAGQGFHTRTIEQTHLRLGEGIAGRAAFERRTVHVPDLPETGSNFTRASLLAGEGFLEYYGVPLIAKGEVKGVLEVFHRASLPSNPEWQDFLETLARQAAITIDQTQLFDDLQRANLELIIAYDATIEGWSHAMDLRIETEGHTLRVAEMTLALAKNMGISEKEMPHIRRGALLHDIGKIGIPDNILHKEGKLTDEEWTIMRRHPTFSYEMLQPIKYLRQSLDIPYCHHEKWDGTGYPRGLKGGQIPLAARIFAVVDVWDAVAIDRPYRKAWTKQKALKHIREQSGKHFEPRVVETFLKLFDTKTSGAYRPSSS